MKFTRAAVYSALVVAASVTTTFSSSSSSTILQVSAFAPVSPSAKSTRRFRNSNAFSPFTTAVQQQQSISMASSSTTALSYTVGIVGATGAVGKEIRQCLENRKNLPVDKLRIFGSSRSAGTTIETESYGTVTVELFDVDKARECDVVFLAVDGTFALEHAEKIAEGPDGAVVIDNSVCCPLFSLFRYVSPSLMTILVKIFTTRPN
jgi:hypothetical protein